MRNKRGLLVILSGPSGCGKGTVMKALLAQRPDIRLSVSVTTRAPREGETDGVQYYFRTVEEFQRMAADGAFLEYAQYNGAYYGTPREAIERMRDEGLHVILEIDVQGALKVLDKEKEAVSVFLAAPSLQELERRLYKRGTESPQAIQNRMKAARWELSQVSRYRYVVPNESVELAVRQIGGIVDAEALRYERMQEYIREVMKEC